MADTNPVTYSLKFQSRALCAVQSSKLSSEWIVGTNSLREENEVRVMQYDADQERLVCSKVLTHAAEIWDIATSPVSPDLIITVWSQAGTHGATLWSLQSSSGAVQQVAELPGHAGIIRRALWHPEQADLAVTIEEGALRTWSVSDQGARCAATAQAGELMQLWSGALQAGNPHMAATAGGNAVQLWDLRRMAVAGEIAGAHRMPVRDVCFSPSSEHRLLSAGDDCKLRVWDTRSLGKQGPLLELGGHSHWVWKAQYCPFYEQLIASGSSDCLVNLYHTPHLLASQPAASASQLASAGGAEQAAAPDGSDAGGAPLPTVTSTSAALFRPGSEMDGKAASYDEHEDSVYGLAWSAADPWLFASLSYDGRVVINKVPKSVKYKIIV